MFDFRGESISGVGTAITLPDVGICLDIGKATREAILCHTVLVTHGHPDHVGAIVQHASIAGMWGRPAPTYVVPTFMAEAVDDMFKAVERMGVRRIPRRIVPLAPGQVHVVSPKVSVRSFETDHTAPSQGYILTRTVKRLAPHLKGKPWQELANLRDAGEVVDVFLNEDVLAYPGDTRPSVLDTVPALTKVHTLIMECTFMWDFDEEKAHARGHCHIQDFGDRSELFENKRVVLTHRSNRYSEADILTATDALPQHLREKVTYL